MEYSLMVKANIFDILYIGSNPVILFKKLINYIW